MEITKLSTKGQIVIPEKFRKDIDTGTAFIVTRYNSLIVLKKLSDLTKEEKEEVEDLDKIWKDIDAGKCKSYTEKEFFEKLKEW